MGNVSSRYVLQLLPISRSVSYCLYRNPVALKRPNSGAKLQQKKESPGLQHRGAGPGVRAQANPKAAGIRDARGAKAKDDKVRQLDRGKYELIWSIAYHLYVFSPCRARKWMHREMQNRISLMAQGMTMTWWTLWREI